MLESALAQPKAKFDEKYIHETIFEKSTACGYHLCKNYPFLDGNKRTALVAIYTYFFVNGYRLQADKKALFVIMIKLANGNLEKEELVNFWQEKHEVGDTE